MARAGGAAAGRATTVSPAGSAAVTFLGASRRVDVVSDGVNLQVTTAADLPLPADGEVLLMFAPERTVALARKGVVRHSTTLRLPSTLSMDSSNTQGEENGCQEIRNHQGREGRRDHLGDLQPSRQAQRHVAAAAHGHGRRARRAVDRRRDRGPHRHRRRPGVLRRPGHQALFPRHRGRSRHAREGAPRLEPVALAEALDLPEAHHRDGQRLLLRRRRSPRSAPAISRLRPTTRPSGCRK